MARKSRRNKVINQNIIQNKKVAALYARISVDSESESIENQLCLLRKYAIEKGYVEYKEYIDIGKSGTNYNRKGFEKMLVDIKNGLVQCVIVKDLSRLGRNYIETGEYVEKIFPLLGIRFIAINDNYDSEVKTSSNIMFNYNVKNLVNEIYARDISKKVSSSIKAKQQSGKVYRSPVIPYGYKLSNTYKQNDNKQKNQNNINSSSNNCITGENYIYEIDEKVAWVVRKIYELYKENVTITEITKWLNLHQINPPQEYRKTGNVYATNKTWCKSSVYRILKNKVYTGTIEVNKTTKSYYADEKKHTTNVNERICYTDVTKKYFLIVTSKGDRCNS